MIYLRFLFRLPLLLVWVTGIPLLVALASAFKLRAHLKLIRLFHGGCLTILGIDVQKSGEQHNQAPVLYVSNHVSYLDVFVLGFLPSYFVAKFEIASWPLIGKLAKLQNTLFIERKSVRSREHIKKMKQHLQQAQSLTLFPEGTCSDGSGVMAFKSSLFEAVNVHDHRVAIQPISICYTHYASEPVNRKTLDYFAWYNDKSLAAHFLNLLTLKSATVRLHFHSVCYMDEFASRKQCAHHCQQAIAETMQQTFESNPNNLRPLL